MVELDASTEFHMLLVAVFNFWFGGILVYLMIRAKPVFSQEAQAAFKNVPGGQYLGYQPSYTGTYPKNPPRRP